MWIAHRFEGWNNFYGIIIINVNYKLPIVKI